MEDDIQDIEVNAEIYRMATAFEEMVDGEGFLLAEELEKLFRRGGNGKMVKRWRAISDYLKEREFAPAEARTVIIP
ncbi:MAG: hypothetical protein AB7R40_23990 [Nitrospiraceae bacterium]